MRRPPRATWCLADVDTPSATTHAYFLLDGAEYVAFAAGDGSFAVAAAGPRYPRGLKVVQENIAGGRDRAERAAEGHIERIGGVSVGRADG